jgi:hypothetical protein
VQETEQGFHRSFPSWHRRPRGAAEFTIYTRRASIANLEGLTNCYGTKNLNGAAAGGAGARGNGASPDSHRATALQAVELGLSPLPPAEDGTKRPFADILDGEDQKTGRPKFTWNPYSTTPATREHVLQCHHRDACSLLLNRAVELVYSVTVANVDGAAASSPN